MPIVEMSAADAVRQLSQGGLKQNMPGPKSLRSGFEGVVEVGFQPSFEIDPGDRVFTVGSCFARNIERRMREVGLDTVMHSEAITRRLAELGETAAFFNKYNISSIRAEMEWALGATRPPEDMLLIPSPRSGAMLDVLANPRRLTRLPPERARALRAFSDELMGELAQCRLVVITLGLVEVWRDTRSGLRLNVIPLNAIHEEPDRFVFEVLSYDDILQDLEAIHALLNAHGHLDVRILATVSPVPLGTTFRDMDVLSANTYSKSVQRAAIDTFALRHANVDYYPSYEMITLTDRRLAFGNDNRHVQDAAVDRVVDRFIRAYAPGIAFEETTRPVTASPVGPSTVEDFLMAAKVHARERQFKQAADLYLGLIDAHGDRHHQIATASLYERLGTWMCKSSRPAEGLRAYENAAEAHDLDSVVTAALIERIAQLGAAGPAVDAERAAALLAKLGQ